MMRSFVVENVDGIEGGHVPVPGRLQGARELGVIVCMTIVLVAAYVPDRLSGRMTRALFTQFAFTLAGAVHLRRRRAYPSR